MSDEVAKAFARRITRHGGETRLDVAGMTNEQKAVAFVAAFEGVVTAALGRPPRGATGRAFGLIGAAVRRWPEKGVHGLTAVRDAFQPIIIVTLTMREDDGSLGPELSVRYPVEWF